MKRKTYEADKLPRETRQALAVGATLALAGFGPGIAADLVSISRQLGRLAERSCNGYQTWSGEWDEKAEQRGARRADKLEALAAAIVADAIAAGIVPAGTRIYRQSDPRGAALYICGPDVPEPLDSNYSQGVAVY